MKSRSTTNLDQLGFDALLVEVEAQNKIRQEEQAHAHLPASMDEALPLYRTLLCEHHVAMMLGDAETVMRLRGLAHALAYKLNNYELGILADDDAPGCVLDRLTRALDGDLYGAGAHTSEPHGFRRCCRTI